MKKILSIDAGGTKIYYAVLDEKGNFLSSVYKEDTPKNAETLKQLFKEIINKHYNNIDYVSFASAGAVNIDNTRIESSTGNMPEGYSSINFQELSDKPVFIENDANAAAWAEYKTGAAIGEDNTITITLGTGTGGGIIVNGKLLRGKSGRAGEIGHIKTGSRKRLCTCGSENCFESYSSGTGLKKTAEETALNDSLFKTSLYKDKQPEDITTYDIIEGAAKGDLFSKKVYDIWIKDIAAGLISAADVFDPESIIISGGMGRFIDTNEMQKIVNAEITAAPVKIKHAAAGNYSGMIGACLLAFEKFSV